MSRCILLSGEGNKLFSGTASAEAQPRSPEARATVLPRLVGGTWTSSSSLDELIEVAVAALSHAVLHVLGSRAP